MQPPRMTLAIAAATVLVLFEGRLAVAEPPAATARPAPSAPASIAFTVEANEIEDFKAVLATVESKDVVEARVRTPGTVVALKVTEGAHVDPGQLLGLVADPKIALRIRASDAQIVALESRLATAKSEYQRTIELQKRGVSPQARLDQAKTAFDVATNDLSAARSERAVLEKQAEEGQVLAPAAGRVLRVPVTQGSVVMAGESIATVAANDYLLRLELPERHARFIKQGDTLRLGQRGLEPGQAGLKQGRIVQVYPEIRSGRVVADAEVDGLGDYFVGERAEVWISAGKRRAILVPRSLVLTRFGLDYVRVATPAGPVDVVVQLGQVSAADQGATTVEVLAGLKPGDGLIQP